MADIRTDDFRQAVRLLLDETFNSVHGIYLDRNTSMFETLAGISAAQASIPVGGRCATLAAQVKHVAFYLDVLEQVVREPERPRVDWDEIWRTVGPVSPDEWAAIQQELRESYTRILRLLDERFDAPGQDELVGAMAMVAHSAYHLGEIRQALCVLQGE